MSPKLVEGIFPVLPRQFGEKVKALKNRLYWEHGANKIRLKYFDQYEERKR